METLAVIIVRTVGIYALFGALFAIVFVIRGVGRIDPDARAGTWGFRLLIFPGVVAFWPYLMRRWLVGATQPPSEDNAHRRAAQS